MTDMLLVMGKHDEDGNKPNPEDDAQGPGPIPPPADPGKHAKDDEDDD